MVQGRKADPPSWPVMLATLLFLSEALVVDRWGAAWPSCAVVLVVREGNATDTRPSRCALGEGGAAVTHRGSRPTYSARKAQPSLV